MNTYRLGLRLALCPALLLAMWVAPLTAQSSSTSSTDGSTPLGLTPGAPLGTYPLSGFEHVNLFNGGLNFRLQLMETSGRGNATTQITVPFDFKWRVTHVSVPQQTGPPNHFYYPTYDWWTLRRYYSPGTLMGRHSGEGIWCHPSYANIWTRTLTRLTFTDSNGTEYDFRDQATDGQPTGYCLYLSQGFNRGKVFVTADGMAATFTSDTDIYDSLNPGLTTLTPSGVLVLRDGTRYRIDQGRVSWMHDRNGNRTVYSYDGSGRLASVTDSINRQVTIAYTTDLDTVTFKSFGGGLQTIQVHYQSLSQILRSGSTIQTFAQLFPGLNGTTSQFNPKLVSRAVLPTGQEYRFRYNSYGELARVELPTGGAIEYDYDGGVAAGAGVINSGSTPDEKAIYRRLMERREYPDGSVRDLRTVYSRPANSSPTVVTVDHYNSAGSRIARQRHTFEGRTSSTFWKTANSYAPWKEGRETLTERFDVDGTTLLQKRESTWQQGGAVAWWTGTAAASPPANPRLTQTMDWVLDNGSNLVAKTTLAYDQYNNITDVYEFDYGNGAAPTYALRRTRTTYVTTNVVDGVTKNYHTDFAIHLRNLSKERWVYTINPVTGTQTLASQVRFNYDRYDTTANHAALVNRTSISGLQSGFTTAYKTRGNVTSSERWLNTPTAGWLPAYQQFDIAGNIVRRIDERGYVTNYDFSDNFGAVNGNARTNTAPAELGTLRAFAFVKILTNPVNQASYVQYDYATGKPVEMEDLNGNLRSMLYDRMGRLMQAAFPDGGRVDVYYSDTDLTTRHNGVAVFSNQTSINPLRRKIYTRVESNLDKVQLTVFDGFGRVSMDGNSNNNMLDWVRTEYHSQFGPLRNSNPFSINKTTEIPSAGSFSKWITNTYDALGRVTRITTPDNQFVSINFQANLTTVRDQLDNPKQTLRDSLGRIVSATEPNPQNALFDSGAMTTTYEYNGLDQLTKVIQGDQQRSFVYDTLGRMISETHPEWGSNSVASGAATYTYDNASNLTRRTDARGVFVNWNSYDGLNRPASKTYSDTTPRVDFSYDSTQSTNGKGRLTSMTDGAGSESYQYNSMGQVSQMTRNNTGGPSLTGNYGYNLIGGLKTAAYPGIFDGLTALTISYGYDNAGRQTSAQWSNGSTANQALVNNYTRTFSASGATEQTFFSNNATETVTYNDRLQPASRSIPNAIGLTYLFTHPQTGKNNGNVFRVTDSFATGFDFDYTYDALNRITSSTGPSPKVVNFSYDRWGNKSQSSTNGPNKPLSFVTNGFNKNRISGTGYSYDNAGNLTAEPSDVWTGRGAMTYQYDAESRIKSTGGVVTSTNSYDGAGRRMKRTSATTRYYFYDVLGNPVWEYTTFWETFNLYFNGKLVFTNTASMNPSTVWLYSDHLGTPRLKARETGQAFAGTRLYYYPFGERASVKSDPVKYEFTGKERDNDTNIDYFGARFYGSSQGRFLTTDPLLASAETSDPQSWNRYSYALNNPLKYLDPNGMEVPKSCINNPHCKIVISVHVLYSPNQKYTDEQKKQLEKKFLEKARKDFKNSNIELKFSYGEGTFFSAGKGKIGVEGAQADKLNVYFVGSTPKPGGKGASGIMESGESVIFVAPRMADELNLYPLSINTLEHEMGHHLLLHTEESPAGFFDKLLRDNQVDEAVITQSLGSSVQGFRDGTEKKAYAAPAHPEVNKPKQ